MELGTENSLKKTLIEKYEAKDNERRRVETEAALLTTKETEERFTLFFGRKPDRVDNNKAYFEDVIVSRNCHSGGGWSVVKVCEKCKKEQAGANCQTFEALGEQISKQTPFCWSCSPSHTAPEPDAEDKILEGLRELIREHCDSD